MASHNLLPVNALHVSGVTGTAMRDARATQPVLQEPVKDPARFLWHEVTKVAHYWLEVNAMTKPMRVREDSPPYPSSPGETR